MENRTYTIEEVKSEASEFLERKRKRNETTYKNYRTSLNYFIYYLTDIAKVNVLGTENYENLVEDFQGSLYEGFTYKVAESERLVKVKASGVNTHIRRIKTFLNSIGLKVEKVQSIKVNDPKYKSLKPEEMPLSTGS